MSKYDEKPKRKGNRFKLKALTKGQEQSRLKLDLWNRANIE
jgi:hypothetical protein